MSWRSVKGPHKTVVIVVSQAFGSLRVPSLRDSWNRRGSPFYFSSLSSPRPLFPHFTLLPSRTWLAASPPALPRPSPLTFPSFPPDVVSSTRSRSTRVRARATLSYKLLGQERPEILLHRSDANSTLRAGNARLVCDQEEKRCSLRVPGTPLNTSSLIKALLADSK